MECYYFCQQYKDHFEIVGVKSHKRVHFAAFFLKDQIFFLWQQHKNRIECNKAVPSNWEEFKAFLQKIVGESTAFVDNILNNIKRNSYHQLAEI